MGLRYPAKPVGRFPWCGPFAVAVVLGIDYDEAHTLFLKDMKRTAKAIALAKADAAFESKVNVVAPQEVSWTYPHQLERLLAKHGVRCAFEGFEGRPPTVQRFAREHTVPSKTYILQAGSHPVHWLIIHDGMMYHSHHRPCRVEFAPRYRMARVWSWAEVKPRPEAFE